MREDLQRNRVRFRISAGRSAAFFTDELPLSYIAKEKNIFALACVYGTDSTVAGNRIWEINDWLLFDFLDSEKQ